MELEGYQILVGRRESEEMIKVSSYHRWDDFYFSLIPEVFFSREVLCERCQNIEHRIGITWFCFEIAIVW